MKIILLKLFLHITPVKSLRRYIRSKIAVLDFTKRQQRLARKYAKAPKFYGDTEQNSVLLVEPNPYHGEIIPGYVRYFQELGYTVDVMCRYENLEENPFAIYPNPPRIFAGTADMLRDWLLKLKGTEYKYIFLTSSAFWNLPEFYGAYLNFLGREPYAEHGIIMVEHNAVPCLLEYNEYKYLKENRLFALTENNGIPRVNPHYFGPVSVHKLNKRKIFVAVGIRGGLSRQTIINTVMQLRAHGHTDFIIEIIGKGNFKVPNQIRTNVQFLGRLNYQDMYDHVAGADFILGLLDPGNPIYDRFKNKTSTSGSLQLSLGFGTPMIIASEFAKPVGLNSTNAIVYTNNELTGAIETALVIRDHEYKQMQSELAKLEKCVHEESLKNLKQALIR